MPAFKMVQLVRGKRGVFALCEDSTNGRIYYRRDGKKAWSRFKGPANSAKRLSLTVGKRGLFCLTGDASHGVIYFRSFARRSAWNVYRAPAQTPTGR